MVILNICNIYDFNALNGMAIAVPRMVINLKKCNSETAFFNLGAGIYNDDSFIGNGKLEIERLPEPFCKPDLVLFHGIWFKNYLKLYKVLVRNGIPYIIIPHGSLTSVALKQKYLKKKIAMLLMFGDFIKQAKTIGYLSAGELEQSRKIATGFVSGLGFDFPSVKKETFPDKIKKLVYIGRVDYYIKGLDMLLNSISSLKEKFIKSGCHVDIYGPYCGDSESLINDTIRRYKIENVVSVHGAVRGKEKENILLSSDMFIQTSRSEGLPQGILEALSYGVPCAITEGTRLGPMVQKYNCGLVCKTNDESICEMISILLDGQLNLANMSDNSRRMISENYTWERVSQITMERINEFI